MDGHALALTPGADVGSADVALWDAELEALRPKLREEAVTFIASIPWQNAGTAGMTTEERVAAQRAAELGGPPSDRAVDRTIEGPGGPLRLRILAKEEPVGVLLHIHGGAWMTGSPETMDLLNVLVADSCGISVVSVDYRLAPEHPYPAGPDDCEAAASWLIDHAADDLGSDRLLIAGESAGAHLAAVTLLRMRDKHHAAGRFLGANLVFGAYDLSRTPSQRGVGVEPGTDILDGTGFPLDLYLPGMPGEERRDPDVSPLYADLRGLPPALFSVGTNDHLLDDTLFMAARWEAAGNRSELLVYPDTPHGCIALPTVADHFFPRLFGFLRDCLEAAPAARA